MRGAVDGTHLGVATEQARDGAEVDLQAQADSYQEEDVDVGLKLAIVGFGAPIEAPQKQGTNQAEKIAAQMARTLGRSAIRAVGRTEVGVAHWLGE